MSSSSALLAVALLFAAVLCSSISADCEGPDCEAQCTWRGSAPVCMGECEDGELKKKEAATAAEAKPYETTFGKECWYGKKWYCCKQNVTDDSIANRVAPRAVAL
ncbi:hypothetical protein PFISCL1PPCAC_27767 [Pristionchus fissidentatus]|uniref:Uncharacterized protein n=1 Tax=Pristionchus fissidentatus TaxID=1538716 RepID=A0AAV5WY90_9BILA|nr:hypothetical protein PFISCL1PPCAC_27767 [Pristionchus fissidentatus]